MQNAPTIESTVIMKYIILITIIIVSFESFAQTPITDANFHQAVDTCLSTNPVDGLCYSSEYGAMPDWDVSAVTKMDSAFCNRLAFNAVISDWEVGNVMSMNFMFFHSYGFNQDIGNWDVSNVNSMYYLFSNARDFNQNISNWNVSNVTNMNGMFSMAISFNQDLEGWDVSNVNDMSGMFAAAYDFNMNINGWNVSSVNDMTWMFANAHAFNQNIGDWDVCNVTSMFGMFSAAVSFNQDISNWCVELIPSEPVFFSEDCPLLPEYHPYWGEECLTGINNIESFNLQIYPNPSESSVTIDINSETINEINVHNQLNQRILHTRIFTGELDISKLRAGLYIIEIVTDETKLRQKIIKK